MPSKSNAERNELIKRHGFRRMTIKNKPMDKNARICITDAGFNVEIVSDVSKSDATQHKLLNVDCMQKLDKQMKTLLRDPIAKAYADFLTKQEA